MWLYKYAQRVLLGFYYFDIRVHLLFKEAAVS